MALGRIVVRISHSSLGGTGSNSWHFRADGPFEDSFGHAEDLALDIKAFYASCGSLFPDTGVWSFDGLILGVGADEGQTYSIANWSQPGSAAGGVLPPQTCIVVGWRTPSGGRSGRGRTFLGPLTTNAVEANGTIETTKLGVCRTAATALVNASTGTIGAALGVFSPQDGVVRDFTSAVVHDKFAYLGSRRD